MPRLEKVAVLGAGVMGARIAAHLANAGLRPVLLDIVPRELTPAEKSRGLTLESPQVRNRLAQGGLTAAIKAKPEAFFHKDLAARIKVGNFEDHIEWLSDADWIIEVVAEDLKIKQGLLEKVEAVRRPGSVVSSNTSGLPLHKIAEGRSEDFRKHWLGTHFFNPPRYMKLLEIIPTPDTSPEVIDAVSAFCDRRLGKVVVRAKDSPNFIANRIGTFAVLNALRLMQEKDLTIEQIDTLTGPAIGFPRSATFRTGDIVGVDVMAHVVRNLSENLPDDERRDMFKVPEFMEKMLKNGWLGEKSGQGFYKKSREDGKRVILTLDWKTMEYRPREKARFGTVDMARSAEELAERIPMLLGGKDTGPLYQELFGELLHYSAMRIPEIAGSVADVDAAMRNGFNWEMGPFELFDVIGVEAVVAQWNEQGRDIPPLVEKLLASGAKSFYSKADGETQVFDLASGAATALPAQPGVTVLAALHESGKVVESNPGASLVDLGDGIVCLEFHSKMNSIGGDTLQMIQAAMTRLESEFDGLVVANQGGNFSAGANLALLLMSSLEQEWDDVNFMIHQFQKATMSLKYAPKPVVVAPHGLTLGGGCEITMHGWHVQAASETYIGLVEAGVGLIPAGGGCKEMALRAADDSEDDLDLLNRLRHYFEKAATATVYTSAEQAREGGYLRDSDGVTMNIARQVEDAKQACLGLVRRGYRVRTPRTDIRVAGDTAYAQMKLGIHMMQRGGWASEHDGKVASKLAWIMSGGALRPAQEVSEQYLLDLEREAFLSLCGEQKTLERIQSVLQTGKPVRN